ncbi:MAG: cupin domain-containing protein [Moritella sp.]|uniref:cupin domain-containing protein n=1 Tax=Moritella sp. TaxID=78556 RepID=UPI0029A1251B|nr:cupin domain-containing protein [Moritella sp.]MDX2320351.1 cupin domain-containing protein [Moritella sp.]
MHNIFDSIPVDLSSEVFEDLVSSDKVKIERIISKGHTSPDFCWYDQEQSEWVIVISGSAIIGFDDKPPVTLKAGDYLNIPAHQKHKVAWTDPNVETVWLAVHY